MNYVLSMCVSCGIYRFTDPCPRCGEIEKMPVLVIHPDEQSPEAALISKQEAN